VGGGRGPHDHELEEIGRIDFLLNELARAVERGEVHRASYDLLAPRYLKRRDQLVSAITGAPTPAAERAVGSAGGPQAFDEYFGAAPGASRRGSAFARPEKAKRERKPVRWTTVLTFLGAFLGVVAAALLALVFWEATGTAGRLGFMGFCTLAFYAAGWYAHKLQLRAGAVALTAVGSAMLLFDGWIVIDGYSLEGPLPWAVLLLVCSLVYWVTEIWLAERFFGAVGAAAQIAWWWLLGEALGLPVPARLAGIALVALAWQIASERASGDETVGSLAEILACAAPITAGIVVLGLLRDLVVVSAAQAPDVAIAIAGSAAAGAVAWRTRLLRPDLAHPAAALCQLPAFAYLGVAWQGEASTWGLFAAALVMALGYDTVALVAGGYSFAVPGLASELLAVLLACDALGASDRVTVVAASALAVAWALGARMTRRAAGLPRAREVGLCARIAAVALLAVASLASIGVGEGIALGGVSLPMSDVVVALAVLAAWYGVALLIDAGWAVLLGNVWSFYALAAVLSWALPNQPAEAYALAFVALSGVWLASSAPLGERYGPRWRDVSRWFARSAVVLSGVAGIFYGAGYGLDESWWTVGLAAAAAVVLLADALATDSRTAAAASAVFAVCATAFAGGVWASTADVTDAAALRAIGAACGAVAVGGAAQVWGRGRRQPLAGPGTAGAAVMASAWAVLGISSLRVSAIAFALLAIAWALAAAASTGWLALPAGFSALVSVGCLVAYNDGAPWITVACMNAAALALGATAFLPAFGPRGRRSAAGLALVASGLLGHGAVVAIGAAGELLEGPGWYAIGLSGVSTTLAFLGAHLLAQGARWRFEYAYYAGGLAWVIGAWCALAWTRTEWAELYTTVLAAYFVGCSYAFVRLDRERTFPVVLDAAAVLLGLGYPLVLALSASGGRAGAHALWVLGLAVVAIAGGVVAKSRWYFFGGVASLAVVAGYRSFVVLAEFWPFLLGLVGLAMLVIALTWERQRMLVADSRTRLKRSFEGWR